MVLLPIMAGYRSYPVIKTSGGGGYANAGEWYARITQSAGSKFWFHACRNCFITVPVRNLMMPESLVEWLVNHRSRGDVTLGYATQMTVCVPSVSMNGESFRLNHRRAREKANASLSPHRPRPETTVGLRPPCVSGPPAPQASSGLPSDHLTRSTAVAEFCSALDTRRGHPQDNRLASPIHGDSSL